MDKQKLLEFATQIAKENETDFDILEDVDLLFFNIANNIELSFNLEVRSASDGNTWLQCEYFSEKICKTVIWNYEVDSFDNVEEFVDYIILTEQEIQEIEKKLPKGLPSNPF